MINFALALDQWADARLLVIGELMLDRYVWGDVERVSPEAPVLVVQADSSEVRPGGAASVAYLVSHLGGHVTLAGAIGNDHDGQTLLRLLVDAHLDCQHVLSCADRPTTCKQRVMGRASGRLPQQIVRIDFEQRRPLSSDEEFQFIEQLAAAIPNHDAVLIADYGKGVCTASVLASVLETARRHRVPVLVDPARGAEYERYRGATVLKPNRTEASLAIGHRIETSVEAIIAGRQFCEKYEFEAVVVTLDADGMVLASENSEDAGHSFPTTAREICDITGAGDMVLSVLGLGMAVGWPLIDVVPLANIAAGLEVQQLGVATISREDLAAALRTPSPPTRKLIDAAELIQLGQHYRQSGKSIVFTNGCFDLLHVGHIHCLEEARCQGDVLFVAINSDSSVRRLKGDTRPVISEQDRARMLAALTCVDHVVIFDDATPHRLLRALQPDLLVKGGTTAEIVGREVVESYGGQVKRTAEIPGISTTSILSEMQSSIQMSSRSECH
jgi:D-beta-D-heptose 7-phosphate kinase/D-beta-D-heptose 1-phosphate adenosyltransferase